MLNYSDLADVLVKDNGESMKPIKGNIVLTKQISKDMLPITGKDIYVRESVLKNIAQAGEILSRDYPTYKLQIVYGYRSLTIQTKLFEQFKKELSTFYGGVELLEAVHKLIAVPGVAGHPTGGAIDIQIVDKNKKPLDFGTKIWDFKTDSYTFSPFISAVAKQNRALLRKVMLQTGFAPFDGEWWHFSYGDKEWAKYYNRPNAIYKQIEFRI